MPRFGCLTVLAALVVGFVAGVLLVVILAWTADAATPTGARPAVGTPAALRAPCALAPSPGAGTVCPVAGSPADSFNPVP